MNHTSQAIWKTRKRATLRLLEGHTLSTAQLWNKVFQEAPCMKDVRITVLGQTLAWLLEERYVDYMLTNKRERLWSVTEKGANWLRSTR